MGQTNGDLGQNQDEMLKIEVSSDKMKATARFYPPSEQGQRLTLSEITDYLASKEIRHGIDIPAIESFLKERDYSAEYIVAKGTEPVKGKDAEIRYHFNRELKARPKLNDDGTVDFHQLNNISHVEKGEVLAVLIKETPGQPGQNIYGEILKPREAKKKMLRFGRNISLSEDKLSIVSDVSGHVSLIDGKVLVSDVYEVKGDVDTSTGDIIYEGSVVVYGNVRSGFKVSAAGNIEVRGFVEAAALEAKGHIVLRRGIQGMGKGSLYAGGNIITKFIESAQATAQGDIIAEAILHSRVSSKGEICVEGRKGYIIGGMVRAANLVKANTLGSPMGSDTVIEVGADPLMKEQYQELKKEVRNQEKELARMMPILSAFRKKLGMGEKIASDKMQDIRKLAEVFRGIEISYEENKNEIEKISGILARDTDARIKVSGTIYPGTRLVISDSMLFIRDERKYSQFVREGAEIKMLPL